MSEIADMMLEGDLCAECGCVLECEGFGIPILCHECHSEYRGNKHSKAYQGMLCELYYIQRKRATMSDIELIKEQIKGQIKGLNTARIRIWGIGYDNDETALMMRRFLYAEITRLQAMLDIDEEGKDNE